MIKILIVFKHLGCYNRERTVVTGVRQGAGIALTAMQLCNGQDFCWVEPRFPSHARPKERAKLVADFTVAAAVVGAVRMEDILRGAGQGP